VPLNAFATVGKKLDPMPLRDESVTTVPAGDSTVIDRSALNVCVILVWTFRSRSFTPCPLTTIVSLIVGVPFAEIVSPGSLAQVAPAVW
jgi:hypothetical protein